MIFPQLPPLFSPPPLLLEQMRYRSPYHTPSLEEISSLYVVSLPLWFLPESLPPQGQAFFSFSVSLPFPKKRRCSKPWLIPFWLVCVLALPMVASFSFRQNPLSCVAPVHFFRGQNHTPPSVFPRRLRDFSFLRAGLWLPPLF